MNDDKAQLRRASGEIFFQEIETRLFVSVEEGELHSRMFESVVGSHRLPGCARNVAQLRVEIRHENLVKGLDRAVAGDVVVALGEEERRIELRLLDGVDAVFTMCARQFGVPA